MADKYDLIFSKFKQFIKDNSKYSARVVKYNTNTSSYFPLITCVLNDNKDTDDCTIDMIERYEAFYFTIDIYTKDMTVDNKKISAQIICDELTKLTICFFGEKLRMKKTLNKPTPNLDTSILRKTIQYQCLIGNVRGNIIRR